MTKLKKILDEQNKTLYEIGRAMGLVTAPSSIRNIATGKTLVSECDFSTVSFLTRFLKVPPEDLMEDFELDGTVENVKYLKNLKNRFSKKLNKLDNQTYFGVYTLNNLPTVVYITEDENENAQISVIFIQKDGTSKTLKGEYLIEEGLRECSFTKTVSEQPLFKDTPLFSEPSLFSDDQNKKGIGKSDSPSSEPSLKIETLSEGTPLKNEPSLFSETNGDSLMREPSINSGSDLKEGPSGSEPSINLETLLKAVDSESGDEIDYFEFMEEINPIILKVFRKN